MNNAWEFRPHVHVTVNPEWWDVYMDEEPDLWTAKSTFECWTSDREAADRWGLNCFGWTDDAEKRGLSINPHNVALDTRAASQRSTSPT